MKELSPESRALLDEVRRVEHLTPSDKARIHSKLSHRIGAGVALGTALTASATVAEAAHTGALATVVAWLPAAAKVLSVVAIAGAVGAGAVKVAHINSASVAALAPVAAPAVAKAALQAQVALLPAPTVASATPVDVTAPEPAPASLQTQTRASKRQSVVAPPTAQVLPVQRTEVPPSAGDHLANQVAAIRTARAAIRNGDGHSAIVALDGQFPEGQAGALAPEAALARVAAYCRLGQVQAARRTVDQFSAQFPDSPLVARMRDSCVGEAGRNQ